MRIKESGWYIARNGNRIFVHAIEPLNAAGERVTFPVKGTYYWKRDGRLKSFYNIWTNTGEFSIFGKTPFDIVAEEKGEGGE